MGIKDMKVSPVMSPYVGNSTLLHFCHLHHNTEPTPLLQSALNKGVFKAEPA
uniref:BURP domain-containing protein n=1 Tax=Echinococcus granulosus TaxID=6210 RepID=A0A068WYN7_ECHGR|nr:hypothetical protein EgrG_000710200 [Echinococcus granulosus]